MLAYGVPGQPGKIMSLPLAVSALKQYTRHLDARRHTSGSTETRRKRKQRCSHIASVQDRSASCGVDFSHNFCIRPATEHRGDNRYLLGQVVGRAIKRVADDTHDMIFGWEREADDPLESTPRRWVEEIGMVGSRNQNPLGWPVVHCLKQNRH